MGRINWWKLFVYMYVIIIFLTSVGHLVAISYLLLSRFSLRFFLGSLRLSLYYSYIPPVIIAATAVLGWNAVSSNNKKTLRTFSILTGMVMCLEIAFCVWVVMEKEDIGRAALDVLREKFPTNGKADADTLQEWDVIQTKLLCCGVHEPADYIGTTIPKSCSDITPTGKVIHPKGCLYPIIQLLTDDFNLASLTLLAIAFIQMPGIFLPWCLSNRIVEGEINQRAPAVRMVSVPASSQPLFHENLRSPHITEKSYLRKEQI